MARRLTNINNINKDKVVEEFFVSRTIRTQGNLKKIFTMLKIKNNGEAQIDTKRKNTIHSAYKDLKNSSCLYYKDSLVNDEVKIKMDKLSSLCKIDNGFLMPEKDKIISYTYFRL